MLYISIVKFLSNNNIVQFCKIISLKKNIKVESIGNAQYKQNKSYIL